MNKKEYERYQEEKYKYKVYDIFQDCIMFVDKYGYNSDRRYIIGGVKDYDPDDEEDIKEYKLEYKYDKRCGEPVNRDGYNVYGEYRSRCEHTDGYENTCHCFEYTKHEEAEDDEEIKEEARLPDIFSDIRPGYKELTYDEIKNKKLKKI